MDFRTKIDAILASKKIALWKLGELSQMVSTLEKAYRENREMRNTSTWKLLERMNINPVWWSDGKGDIFVQGNNGAERIQSEDKRIIDPGGDYIYVNREAYLLLQETLRQCLANVERLVAINADVAKTNGELVQLAHNITLVFRAKTTDKKKDS